MLGMIMRVCMRRCKSNMYGTWLFSICIKLHHLTDFRQMAGYFYSLFLSCLVRETLCSLRVESERHYHRDLCMLVSTALKIGIYM
jgi:hypothetical protein